MSNKPSQSMGGALLALVLLGAGSAGALAQSDDPVASLPSGPKVLLTDLSDDPTALIEIASSSRSSEEWVDHLTSMETTMTEDQVLILADYLAFNVPAEASGDDSATVAASLPADGRELFANSCFSCHGVVSYYLTQDRDAAGWMGIFDAPYHRRLLTRENERETFSSYAAHAMPVPEDEIPEAWLE